MKNKIFEVGGCVRDAILGIPCDDIDFVFVSNKKTLKDGFDEMKKYLIDNGFKIFISYDDCVTIKAKFPKNDKNSGLVADFVLARKEIGYDHISRKPILEIGTLKDDLIRRDFTVNAMAKDLDGNIIDFHNGLEDLKNKILKTPISPLNTMIDDPLRMLRALRFSITKNFEIDNDVWLSFFDDRVFNKFKNVVSDDRIREELKKMFQHDTIKSMKLLNKLDNFSRKNMLSLFFNDTNWLLPTNKKK